MLTTTEQDKLRKAFPVVWFLWGALFASNLLYVLLVSIFGEQIRGVSTLAPSMQTYFILIFGAMSLIELGIAFSLRKRQFSRPAPGQAPTAGSSKPHPALGRYLTTMLICQMLCVSIGIYGFILFMIGGTETVFFAFCAAAGLSMLFFRPDFDRLLQVVETYDR